MMRSLYLPGWRQFHPWNWYCIITVISPYWPPISSCIRRASTGVGPFRLGLELQPLVVGVHAPLLWGSTLVAARLGGGRHPGVTPASPRPRGVEELPQPDLDGVADAAQVRGRGQGDGRVGEVAGLGQAGPEPAGGVALGPDTDDEDAGPLGAGVVAGRVHGPGRCSVASRRRYRWYWRTASPGFPSARWAWMRVRWALSRSGSPATAASPACTAAPNRPASVSRPHSASRACSRSWR